MDRTIAQRLVDRINLELSTRNYQVVIDKENSSFSIEGTKLIKFLVWLKLVGLDRSLIELECRYPINVDRPLVVQPELFSSPNSGGVGGFWDSFLPFVEAAVAQVQIDEPREFVEILENKSGDYREVADGEQFWQTFWMWIEVKIGAFVSASEKNSVDGIELCQLLPKETVLAIWRECVESGPSASSSSSVPAE